MRALRVGGAVALAIVLTLSLQGPSAITLENLASFGRGDVSAALARGQSALTGLTRWFSC